MFKNRAYINGLGVGLIVGAILLQMLIFAVSSQKQSPGKPTGVSVEEMDQKKLKDEALKYYKLFGKDEIVYTKSEMEKEVQNKVREEKDKLAANTSTVKSTAIFILPGMDATMVSELLYKSQIITDRKALEEELTNKQWNGKIQVGLHLFEGNLKLEQIIQNLITKF